MQTKRIGKTSMRSASDVLDETRGRLVYLVEREERNTGSRTTAYANVAAMIGRSPSWVRSLFNGYSDAVPDLVTGLNIFSLYDNACSRVEAKGEQERRLAALRRDEFYAANPGIVRLVQGAAGTQALGTQAEEAE